jgi:hypothetical protein
MLYSNFEKAKKLNLSKDDLYALLGDDQEEAIAIESLDSSFY